MVYCITFFLYFLGYRDNQMIIKHFFSYKTCFKTSALVKSVNLTKSKEKHELFNVLFIWLEAHV